MKISDILTEGVSDKLYHCATFAGAMAAIKSGILGKHKGPISFARSAYGAYHRDNKLIGVIFEVNGRKLSYNYKGAPVGGENWSYDEEDYDLEDRDTWEFQGKTGQVEDRIEGPILNFAKYIVRAIIYVPQEYINASREDEFRENYDESLSHVMDLINLLHSKNILVQYVIKESQLARDASASYVSEGDFIKMLTDYNPDFAKYLPAKLQPKVSWSITGSYLLPGGDPEDMEDYTRFELEFYLPIVSSRQSLIKQGISVIKEKYKNVRPGDMHLFGIHCNIDDNRSFDIDMTI